MLNVYSYNKSVNVVLFSQMNCRGGPDVPLQLSGLFKCRTELCMSATYTTKIQNVHTVEEDAILYLMLSDPRPCSYHKMTVTGFNFFLYISISFNSPHLLSHCAFV